MRIYTAAIVGGSFSSTQEFSQACWNIQSSQLYPPASIATLFECPCSSWRVTQNFFFYFFNQCPRTSIEKAAVQTAGVRHGGGPGLSLQALESPGEPELLSREVAGWHTNPFKVNSFWHQSHCRFCCISTLLESDVAHLNTLYEVQNWVHRHLSGGLHLFWPVCLCEAKVWTFRL